jgi:hypothetical protein
MKVVLLLVAVLSLAVAEWEPHPALVRLMEAYDAGEPIFQNVTIKPSRETAEIRDLQYRIKQLEKIEPQLANLAKFELRLAAVEQYMADHMPSQDRANMDNVPTVELDSFDDYTVHDMIDDLKHGYKVPIREGFDNGWTISATESAGQQLGVPTVQYPTPFAPTHPTGNIFQQVNTLLSFGHHKNPNPRAPFNATAEFAPVMGQQGGHECLDDAGLGVNGEFGEWDCSNSMLFYKKRRMRGCRNIPPNDDPNNFYFPNHDACPVTIYPDITATRILRYHKNIEGSISWTAPFTSYRPELGINANVTGTVLGANDIFNELRNELCIGYVYPATYPYVDWFVWKC